MLVLLCVGIVLWLGVDPTQQVFKDPLPNSLAPLTKAANGVPDAT